jgi:AraC family ethanolamine operon transcriptional activator
MARCSERMLQYAFRDIYGMGPQAWFQAMKLKEANRELSTHGSRTLRVSDVALRWGFTHFGRFSLEYRRMFGESPSETLKRRPGSNVNGRAASKGGNGNHRSPYDSPPLV